MSGRARRGGHLAAAVLAAALAAAGAAAEERTCLNGVWEFEPQQQYAYPAAFTTNIYVPSFWNHPESFNYPAAWYSLPAGWFRRTVLIPNAWEGQRIALRFDGMFMTGQVFFNGRQVAQHWDAINPLTVDVTPGVRWGETNEIVVGVREAIAESDDLFQPFDSSRIETFQPGGTRGSTNRALVPYGLFFTPAYRQNGLARDVWLIRSAPVYADNVFIQTSVRRRELTVDYELRNRTGRPRQVTLAARVAPAGDADRIVLALPRRTVIVPAGGGRTVRLSRAWPQPELWDPDHPYLYRLHTELTAAEGDLTERSAQRFGFREVWARGDKLYLNGRRLNLRGDTVIPVGSLEIYEEPAFRELCRTYKRMNVNAIRFHGHSGTLAMFDILDEVGLLVISESGLHGSCGDQALTAPLFWRNAQEHLRSMVREERNHPCIVAWSVENEIGAFLQQVTKPVAWDQLSALTRVVKANDPTRLAWHEGFAYIATDAYTNGTPVQNDLLSLHYPHGEFWAIYYNFPECTYWMERIKQRRGGFGGLPVGQGEFAIVPITMGWETDGTCYTPLHLSPLIGEGETNRWHWDLHWQMFAWSVRGQRDSDAALIGPLTFVQHYLQQSGGRWDDIHLEGRTFDWNTPGLKFPVVHRDHYPLLDVYSGARPPYRWLDMIVPAVQAYDPLLCFARSYNTRFWGGARIARDVVVFNDLYRPEPQTLAVRLSDAVGRTLAEWHAGVNVPVGEHRVVRATLRAPAVDRVTPAWLTIRHATARGRVFEETVPAALYPPIPVPAFVLFDPERATARQFAAAGLRPLRVDRPPSAPRGDGPLVIAENALPRLSAEDLAAVKRFAEQGGTVVCLAQTHAARYAEAWGAWAELEDRVPRWSYEPGRGFIPTTIAHVTGRPGPLTAGLTSADVRFWAPDHAVAVFGLKLKPGAGAVSSILCNRPIMGDNRSLLAEFPLGKGRVVLCQLLLAGHVRDEPVARLLLARMVGPPRP